MNKNKVCRGCGLLNSLNAKECELCKTKEFIEKYKGTVTILDSENSDIAKKLSITDNGSYALKY